MNQRPEFCRLDGCRTTLVFCWQDGPPAVLYHGAKLPESTDLAAFVESRARPLAHAVLDVSEPVSLHPESGRGFLGYPAMSGRRNLADWEGRMAFQSVERITNGYRFHLADRPRQLSLSLRCVLDPITDVAVFSSRLENTADTPFDLDWLCAAAIAADATYTDAMTFHGRWCAEFETLRQPIQPGLILKENRRGRTSHDSFPAAILSPASTDQDQGPCLGAHLGWSGNHRLVLEKLPNGDLQLQLGVLFQGGEGQIPPGGYYDTPPLYVAHADQGLNALSQKFHGHLRQRAIRFPAPASPRPLTVNTWEAVYFDHDAKSLTTLVDAAAAIGAERFVLDDGWFRGRADDRSGLGDWFADDAKYPAGLKPVADYVRDKGMQFGLWVEPEMANPNSRLLSDHPDWVLGLPPYPALEGRHQLVLDLTRKEVSAYLFERLSALLSENDIAYLKWDMNRDLVLAGDGQGRAASYRQTLALYGLIDRLRQAFPALEIESCASGGGRVDYGMAERAHRFWPSDSNDPVERTAIQSGFSYFFPPEVMGSHIGPQWAHTSGRGCDIQLRCLVAGIGHMGIEADLRSLDKTEINVVKEAVARYKADREIWHQGLFFRIATSDPALTGFAAVAADQSRARLILVQSARPASSGPPPLILHGLDPRTRYKITLTAVTGSVRRANRSYDNPLWDQGVTLAGAALEKAGLILPALSPQSALALSLEAVDG